MRRVFGEIMGAFIAVGALGGAAIATAYVCQSQFGMRETSATAMGLLGMAVWDVAWIWGLGRNRTC